MVAPAFDPVNFIASFSPVGTVKLSPEISVLPESLAGPEAALNGSAVIRENAGSSPDPVQSLPAIHPLVPTVGTAHWLHQLRYDSKDNRAH